MEGADRHKAITDTRTGLVASLAALGAGVGLAYTARTYRLSREGHITDRYSKAIEQLGSDKIEVQLGGIYALERLMRDSQADQPTITEALAAYVREHAPTTTTPTPTVARNRRVAGFARQPKAVLPDRPAEDVQAVLTVLGRRTPVRQENPVALENTHLAGARLNGADLTDAHLNEANLTDVHLNGANLTDAWLVRANLTDAWLNEANLTDARLNEANLTDARLDKANLTDAQLVGANLTDARLDGANLTGAQLYGADLTLAKVTKDSLTQEQLATACGTAVIVWLDAD